MNDLAARASIWEGSPERLDRVLTVTGLARSRTRASELIAAGSVVCDGTTVTKPSTRVPHGSRLELRAEDRYVSRGAYKLLAALQEFGVDPSGRTALDIGASTGGFTQVLLEQGAAAVVAVDVGHGQLAPELSNDPRVTTVEGCNARDLTAERLRARVGTTEPPTLVVADLSFISLTLILPAIARTVPTGTDCLLLVKPQFEVGRVRKGVVTDAGQWAEAIRTVITAAAAHGFAVNGLSDSPILGGEGNREFLLWITYGNRSDPTEWEDRIRRLCGAASGIGSRPGQPPGSAATNEGSPDERRAD